jgi:hypothetical protein
MQDFASAIGSVVSAIRTMIGWIDKIPSLPTGALGLIRMGLRGGGGGSSSGGGDFRAAPTATTTAPAQAPAPPTVVVTEEQVYRAIQRLIVKGQGRNGRLVMVG